MTTLRIANGDIAVDEDRGVLETVTSLEEGAQNVARHILCEYSTFFDEGNELLTLALGNTPAQFAELVVDGMLTEAVNRLIVKQRNADTGNQITKVLQVKTNLSGLSSMVFLIEVLFEDNERVTVVDSVNIRPVELNHTFDPGSVLLI